MKNNNSFRIAFMLAICLILAVGCGKESTIENADNTATNENKESTAEDSTSLTSQEAYDRYKDYISAKDKNEIQLDDESNELYSGFILWEIEATFDKNGDITRLVRLSDVLVDGQSYTLGEIEELICQGCDSSEGWEYKEYNLDKYVDIGLDNTYELKLDIGSTYLNLTLIIKNINGSLKICFAGDSWQRSKTTVLYSGAVTVFNSEDNVTHTAERGYINKYGNYCFWDASREEGYNICDEGDLYYNDHFIGNGIGMYVEEFSFDREKSTLYYYVQIVDKDNIVIDEELAEEEYKLARTALEDEGKNVVTVEEAQILQNERRLAIGFDDDIYYYGFDLKTDN